MLRTYTKYVGERLNYTVDWSDDIGTDTITSSSWTADPGITENDGGHDASTSTAIFSGGTVRTAYKATNTVTTTAGLTLVREIRIVVKATP